MKAVGIALGITAGVAEGRFQAQAEGQAKRMFRCEAVIDRIAIKVVQIPWSQLAAGL